jgi:hypothetical protein
MARESSLTKAEKESLTIERFIFHIIVKEEDEPRYLDEVRLGASERGFFRDRIAEASEGTQFVFVPEVDSTPPLLARLSRQILQDGADFIGLSKNIAQEFKRRHKGNTSNGVFLIAVVSIMKNGAPCRLLSLIKVDHTRVLQFETEGTTAILKELANTFVEDKAAIQKMALVDPSQAFAWDVLGSERRSPDDLAKYFIEFLGVAIRENAYALTQRAVKVVKAWSRGHSSDALPEGENLTTYKGRAVSYLESHDLFDTQEFINTVVRDGEDESRKREMMESLREDLAEAGIAGQSFSPRPDSLKSVKRSKAKTSRNVRIIWDGDPETRGITLPTEPDSQGRYHVEIVSDTPLVLE